jgi:DNA-nicking Smr family endonuclease
LARNKHRYLSQDDITLFRESVGPIIFLQQDKVTPTPKRPRPFPRNTLENQRQVLHDSLYGDPFLEEAETGEELLFSRPGLQHRLLRRLRRGQFSVGAELDLHGLSVPEAYTSLTAFLKKCRLRNVHCVRIVHGKGLKSPQGRPVLKGKVERWLRLRDEVVAFSSARPVDGGTGALYVLLKRL